MAGDYVKKKRVIEKIEGKYICAYAPRLAPLIDELNEAVESILGKKDLTQYQSKQEKNMHLTKKK